MLPNVKVQRAPKAIRLNEGLARTPAFATDLHGQIVRRL